MFRLGCTGARFAVSLLNSGMLYCMCLILMYFASVCYRWYLVCLCRVCVWRQIYFAGLVCWIRMACWPFLCLPVPPTLRSLEMDVSSFPSWLARVRVAAFRAVVQSRVGLCCYVSFLLFFRAACRAASCLWCLCGTVECVFIFKSFITNDVRNYTWTHKYIFFIINELYLVVCLTCWWYHVVRKLTGG